MMKKKLLIRNKLTELLDFNKILKKVMLTVAVCASFSAAFATNDPPTCLNYGPEDADNIVYKVNGSVVGSLSGNVSSGDHVEICFSLTGDGDATMFTLVSYSAPGASFDANTAYLQTIFDVDTKTFSGSGTCCLSVDVPSCYFQLDLVKGCAITQLGPNGSNNFYGEQGRLVVGLNGGTGTCNCVASADASVDITLNCGELQTTITGSTYTHNPTVSWVAINGGVIVSGANTLTPLVSATGSYILSVEDSLECVVMDTVDVTIYTDIDVNLGNDTVVTSCEASLTLDAGVSGMLYLWSTGATTQTIEVTASGTFSVVVTNEGQCISMDTINVTINPTSLHLGNDTILCAGTALMLDAGNAGLDFMWSTGATSQTIEVTATGSYFVSVTEGQCVMTDTIHVTVLTAFDVDLGSDIIANTCELPVILNAGNPGMLYIWSTGASTQTISVTQSGTYYVSVSIGGMCMLHDTISVTINPLNLHVDLGNDTILCAGQTIMLDAGNAGLDFMWSTSATTQTLTVSTSGVYSVMVMDGICMAMDTIEVVVLPELTVDLGADTTVVFCIGSLTLDAGTSGMMYMWSTGATTQTIEVTASGTYDVMITNLGGCMVMDTINVTVNPGTITVDLGMDTTISTCTHETVMLDAGITGSLYTWSNGSTSQMLEVTTTGTYYVDVVDILGCMASDTVDVTIIDNTIDLDLGPDTTVCQCILLTAPSATMYTWCNGSDYQQINVCSSGSYCVTVSNGVCMASDTVMITINTPPTVDLGMDTVVVSGSVMLDAGVAASYMWSTGATTQTLMVTTSGTYYVTITDVFGCTATDTIIVTVMVGIEEFTADAVSVYPNPTEGYISIDLGAFGATVSSVKISNTLGQVVYSETASQLKQNKVKTVDLNGNEKGIYFLSVQSGNQLITKKIVLR